MSKEIFSGEILTTKEVYDRTWRFEGYTEDDKEYIFSAYRERVTSIDGNKYKSRTSTPAESGPMTDDTTGLLTEHYTEPVAPFISQITHKVVELAVDETMLSDGVTMIKDVVSKIPEIIEILIEREENVQINAAIQEKIDSINS